MTKWYRSAHSLAHLAAASTLAVLSACAPEDGDDSDVSPSQAELASMQPLPLIAGLTHVETGRVKVVPSFEVPEPKIVATPNARETLSLDFGMDDLVRGRRYRITVPANAHRAASDANESPVQVSPADKDAVLLRPELSTKTEKGWSDNNSNGVGDDNRGLRDATATPIFRRYGRLDTGCTASMIRQTNNGTFALTAAHCVYNNAGQVIWTIFEPALGSTSYAGIWDVAQVFRYDAFVNNCTAGLPSMSVECVSRDVAILRLTPRAGATYLGGMTYALRNTSTLNASSPQKWHVGYPICSAPGAPSGCINNRLYGDNNPLTVGDWSFSNRAFQHTSDLSQGHSGGPMEIVESGVTKIWGVQSSEWCSGTCTNNGNQPRVNLGKRIDQHWYDYMLSVIGETGCNC